MKAATLACIAPLLEYLRAHPALREVRPTVFHLDGRDFIHFHEEAAGIVADVRLAKGQIRMPVSLESEQAELLERLEETLAACARSRKSTFSRDD